MPGIDIDLNQTPPESTLDDHIDWDEIEEWDGPTNELDYDMIWHDGDEGDQDGDETNEGVQVPAADQDVDGQGAVADGQGATADQDNAAVHAMQAGVPGSNNNKRRYYGDELKIAIYLELLAKTDPPILRHGVSKGVARKFGVPLRVEKNRSRYGSESIKVIPLKDRTTLRDLAHALGVKKSRLHNCLKEGYFRQHTNDLKFNLTNANKKARVKYCLSMLYNV
ncbi:hypothetical protein PVAP13_3NG234515 [Panicum virgatum]|uniref:Uncharacterized protein n=1 Tax=Panicum virgatum TaxID=38727 RepID=A0A8T0UG14_PANVG|nr:hypothetical protein PVAP13_3NG234515 [Panicum virgatum]